MMVAAILLTGLPRSNDFVLAMAARFYYRDARKSHFQNYLVAPDGRRRRFSFGTNVDEPEWLDRNHVAWVEWRNHRDELWVLTLPTFRRSMALAAKGIRFYEDLSVHADGRIFRLSASGLSRVTSVQIHAPTEDDDMPEIEIMREKGKTSIKWNAKEYRLTNPNQTWHTSDMEPYLLGLNDDYDTVNALYGPASVRRGNLEFLTGSFGFTAHSSTAVLFRLDLKQRTATILPQDAESVAISKDATYFIARSGRRLDPLKNWGDVWTAKLYYGLLPSGRYHEIPLPTCNPGTPRLRPMCR